LVYCIEKNLAILEGLIRQRFLQNCYEVQFIASVPNDKKVFSSEKRLVSQMEKKRGKNGINGSTETWAGFKGMDGSTG
jgi:hypothetical protein